MKTKGFYMDPFYENALKSSLGFPMLPCCRFYSSC